MTEKKYFPILEIHYLEKSKVDEIKSYIKQIDNLLTFKGKITPDGYCDVKIFYVEKTEIPKKDLGRYYKTLLSIIVED